MVGLSDAASFTADGQAVAAPVFPCELHTRSTRYVRTSRIAVSHLCIVECRYRYELQFSPARGAPAFPDQKKTDAQLLKELETISAGTPLFDVYSFATPADKQAGAKALLGRYHLC